MDFIRLRSIGVFLAEWVRLRVAWCYPESAYNQRAEDRKREMEALEWAEATFCDMADDME